MTTRNAPRAGAVCAVTGLSVLVASPAVAVQQDAGSEPGEPLSPLMTLLLFVVVPIGLFLLIALLVSLPSIIGGPRYRPGVGWRATPEWYGGPEVGEESGSAGPPSAPAGAAGEPAGGAPGESAGTPTGQRTITAGDTSTDAQTGARGDSEAESSDGGASARW